MPRTPEVSLRQKHEAEGADGIGYRCLDACEFPKRAECMCSGAYKMPRTLEVLSSRQKHEAEGADGIGYRCLDACEFPKRAGCRRPGAYKMPRTPEVLLSRQEYEAESLRVRSAKQ
jgi:hypothetical protein